MMDKNSSEGPNATSMSSNLTTLIKEKMEDLPTKSYNPCIYKIPKDLRSVNEKAYTPCRVAIGPYHANDPALKSMEQHKLRFLHNLIARTDLQLENFVEKISLEAVISRARQCYGDIHELSSVRFAEILLIDGAFIIEFFLSLCDIGGTNANMLLQNSRIRTEILRDFNLLENQLPFFILELLGELKFHDQSFIRVLACSILSNTFPIKIGKELSRNFILSRIGSTQIMHLVHLMTLLLQDQETGVEGNSCDVEPIDNFTSISATELHEAGVKFKILSTLDQSLLKLKFNGGVLEMPYLTLDELTESFFRNLMAFEQYYLNTFDITSFMYFMDHLIDTPKDVQILQKSNVIENWLESKENVTSVFNTISKHTNTDFSPELRQVIRDMKRYAQRPWNEWKARLRRDYFGSPWAIISFLAALTLLILTFIQTFASLRQSK